MDQRRGLPEEGLRRRRRDRVRGRAAVRARDRHGGRAARACHQGVVAEPALPGRAGLVLPPGRQGGRHRRLVHGGGAGERRTLTTKETTMTKRAGLAAAVALTFSILGPGVRADVMPGDKIPIRTWTR